MSVRFFFLALGLSLAGCQSPIQAQAPAAGPQASAVKPQSPAAKPQSPAAKPQPSPAHPQPTVTKPQRTDGDAQRNATGAVTGYQPLPPTGVWVSILGGKPVPGNLVGEFATTGGARYLVDTKHGRTVVDGWALLGVPSLSEASGSPPALPSSVHTFR